jgi:hypothetical protein
VCGAYEFDCEASLMRKPWPTRGVEPRGVGISIHDFVQCNNRKSTASGTISYCFLHEIHWIYKQTTHRKGTKENGLDI